MNPNPRIDPGHGLPAGAEPRLFAFADDACQSLADSHGTPLFAYDAIYAEQTWIKLRAVLPGRLALAYAMKANPHRDLLALFANLGSGFDCASAGELERAKEAGARRIWFSGPGKRREELALALALGARIQAEGWEDLERLDQLGEEIGPTGTLDVNLRIHPKAGVQEAHRIIGGTGPSAFGVDEENVPELLERARGLRHVRLRGIHVFAASNERNAEVLLTTHGRVLEMARGLAESHGLEVEQIDLGGGLGVPYAPGEAPLDLARLGQGLAELLEAHSWFTGELVLEPGRYLAAPCGLYLVRVLRVKESRGQRFAILEGGINHLLRPLLTGQAFPVKAIGRSEPTRPTVLAGPLCTSLDRLGSADLPDLRPGDLLAFGQTGAYGATEAMPRFLCHKEAKEVWVGGVEPNGILRP